MSELGELLAAAHGVAQRRVTRRGAMRPWRHQPRISAGFERWTGHGSGPGPSIAGVAASMRATSSPGPDEEEYVVALAAAWPDRFRLGGRWLSWGPSLTVIDGTSWMTWSPEHGASSNFGDPHHQHGNPAFELPNPLPLLLSDITELRRAGTLGRPTWQLVAHPRDRQLHLDVRWAWHNCIDDYLVDVDRETGLVIDVVGRVDGQDAIHYGFDQLETGVELDPGLFSLVPPDGSEPADTRTRHQPPRHLPLEQAAAEAEFQVFVPTVLPDGVFLQQTPFFWNGVARSVDGSVQTPVL